VARASRLPMHGPICRCGFGSGPAQAEVAFQPIKRDADLQASSGVRHGDFDCRLSVRQRQVRRRFEDKIERWSRPRNPDGRVATQNSELRTD